MHAERYSVRNLDLLLFLERIKETNDAGVHDSSAYLGNSDPRQRNPLCDTVPYGVQQTHGLATLSIILHRCCQSAAASPHRVYEPIFHEKQSV